MSLLGLNTLPAERARGCVFAENFESEDHVERNGGTIAGAPVINFGATLDGASDYIEYPGFGLADWGQTISVVFRIKTTSDVRQAILGNFDGTDDGLLVDLLANGTIRASFNGGPTRYKYRDSVVTVNDDARHFVCITFDGTTILIYIDGVLSVGTQTNLGVIADYANSTSFYVAKSYSGVFKFGGSLDRLKIFNQLLTAQEASDYYNQTTFAYRWDAEYPMLARHHDPTNNRTLDVSGNGHHLTFGDGVTGTTFPTKLAQRGYSFDGGDYLLLQDSPDIRFGVGDFTVFVHFSIGDVDQRALIAKGSTGGGEWLLYTYLSSGAARIRFYGDGGAISAIASIGSRIYGNHVVVFSRSSDSGYLFFDGNAEAIVSGIAAVNLSTDKDVSVGADNEGTGRLSSGTIIFSSGISKRFVTETQVHDITKRLMKQVNHV